MTCGLCGQQVYRVLNPRTGRAFLVNTYTGRVQCSRNANVRVPLDYLPHVT